MTYPISMYLVQTGTFRKNEDEKFSGIDRFVKFDYMGAAEYEFGALPKSLRAIRKSGIDSYDNFVHQIAGVEFIVLVPKHIEKQVIIGKIEEAFLSGKYLRDKITMDSDFFWDISNHIIFFKKENNHQTIINSIFK